MKRFGFVWAAVSAAAVACANPLGFGEWTQTVEAEFASPADAANAELRCRNLPKGMIRAFGCRWDDANALHAAKGEMMTRAGVKGTFFLDGGNPKFYTDVAPKLIAAGHAIGNHSLSHAFMQELSPNRAWREILEQRIKLETRLDVPVAPQTGSQLLTPQMVEVPPRIASFSIRIVSLPFSAAARAAAKPALPPPTTATSHERVAATMSGINMSDLPFFYEFFVLKCCRGRRAAR